MRRVVLFILLTMVFLVWTFPHKLVVERVTRRALAGFGVAVELDEVRVGWPPLARMSISVPLYHVTGVRLSRDGYAMSLSSVYLSFGLRGGLDVEADACGGTWRARVKRGQRAELTFTNVDPSVCMTLGDLGLSGNFGGRVELRGIGRGSPRQPLGTLARTAEFVLDGRDGTVSGRLPPSDPGGREGRSLGEWEFSSLRLEARLDEEAMILEDTSARAQGIHWRVVRGRLAAGEDGRPALRVDFEARRADDTLRSKAVLALLPRATETATGWRRYRLSGSLARPALIGLE